MTQRKERAPLPIVVPFMLAMGSALAFGLCYGFNLGNEALGATIGGAFFFAGVGLAVWAHLVDQAEPEYVEERAVGASPAPEWQSFEKALTAQPVPRSKLLWGMLATTFGSIGFFSLFPIRSMFFPQGLTPAGVLNHTRWKRGQHLITDTGERIKPDDLQNGSVLTAFPAGIVPSQVDEAEYNADAMVLLIRVDPALLQLPPHRMDWVVDGVVAYSKLCTHVGCPVGLYADRYAQLLCPCHHAIFDVLQGAKPINGPAARPLPQLPMGTDSDGYLIALGDFTAPTGAGWWGQ